MCYLLIWLLANFSLNFSVRELGVLWCFWEKDDRDLNPIISLHFGISFLCCYCCCCCCCCCCCVCCFCCCYCGISARALCRSARTEPFPVLEQMRSRFLALVLRSHMLLMMLLMHLCFPEQTGQAPAVVLISHILSLTAVRGRARPKRAASSLNIVLSIVFNIVSWVSAWGHHSCFWRI